MSGKIKIMVILAALCLGALSAPTEKGQSLWADSRSKQAADQHQKALAENQEEGDDVVDPQQMGRLKFLISLHFWVIFFGSGFVLWWVITKLVLRNKPF